MNSVANPKRPDRVLSGMRPTGNMHLGNYHGALKNWVGLQLDFECFFFVADWHALTTNYEETKFIEQFSQEMVIDWLGAGLSPEKCTIFRQSSVPEHAELHLFLSMITPLAWVERVPTYKEMIDSLESKDLATYGFLGYPVLQAADILMYRAERVPVGEDQAPHVEMSREIARRFNDIYGRGPNFDEEVSGVLGELSQTDSEHITNLHKRYREAGEEDALQEGIELLSKSESVSSVQAQLLEGYLRGTGKVILVEPRNLHTETPKVPGLDGRKMSKSYGNTILLRESPDVVETKVSKMQTDPARVRLKDPGDPEKCPVFELERIYLDEDQRTWVTQGCTTASIGCRECKQLLIDAINIEQTSFRERAQPYVDEPSLVSAILEEGSERAREVAKETMQVVRSSIGIANG